MSDPALGSAALAGVAGVMVEGYLAPGARIAEAVARVNSAATALTEGGDPIALLLTVTVATDEATLWFFASAAEATVGRLVERAGLPADRIVACRIEHALEHEVDRP